MGGSNSASRADAGGRDRPAGATDLLYLLMPCLPEPGFEATTGDEGAVDDAARPAQAAAAEAAGAAG
jgi:hypothetical protein